MKKEQPPGVARSEGAGSQVPQSIRPGDVLADRYLLVDLLAETGSGRFWRAHDRVLERHVAVHVVSADDACAAAMMAASRSSAAIHDRRVLRVLDVDERAGLCYVVNEWGSGTSLDILVSAEGPVGARRAAWIVSEVAAALVAAHEAGVAHGRLNPENVLVDDSGSVRVIGCAVECALLGLPPGRISSDVTDLAGLLYFLLTGTWPGVTRSAMPPAPSEGGRVLRPRQVKAGVPRVLDALCDRVLNPHTTDAGDSAPPTARSIRDALREFVGDPSGLATAEVTVRPGQVPVGARLVPMMDPAALDPQPTRPPGPPPGPAGDDRATPDEPADPEQPEEPEQPGPEPSAEAAPHDPTAGTSVEQRDADPASPTPAETEASLTQAAPTAPAEAPAEPSPTVAMPSPAEPSGPPSEEQPPTEQPTQAGTPIFGEDDDVAWFSARPGKPPPPPAFEEPPERPLFAPEPSGGAPVRRPRPGAAGPAGTGDYWPWEAGTSTGSGVLPVTDPDDEDEDGMPGRSWLRLAAAVGLSTLLLVAVVFAFNLGRGRSPLGDVPSDDSPTDSPTPSVAEPTPLAGIAAADLDPQGAPPEENPDLTPLAVDGDPATAWRTSTYEQDLGPLGLKTGVGLVLDLGAITDVSEVDLTFKGAPTELRLYVTRNEPSGVSGLSPLEAAVAEGPRHEVVLDEAARGRFLVVWLTSLPPVPDGFRGEVAEVVVRG